MRHRFNQKFIKVGPAHGESLPAACYEILAEEGWNRSSDVNKKLRFGSETTGRLGFYIGILATEIKLLIERGEDYSTTVMELYYALNAINRLDDYAEMILEYQDPQAQGPPPSNGNHCNPCALSDINNNPIGNATWDPVSQHWLPKPGSQWNLSNSRNGYFVRNDAPPGFISNFPDANIWIGGVTRPWSSTAGGRYDFDAPCSFGAWVSNPDDLVYTTNMSANGGTETSQDQIYGLLMGLKLVKKFVPVSIMYNGDGLRTKGITIAQRLLALFGGDNIFESPVTGVGPCNDGFNGNSFAASINALKMDFFLDVENNANTQLLLPGTLDCSGSYDLAVSHRCLYSMISAIANTTSHEDLCDYVSTNGYDWQFYYLIRQALYPHASDGGCEYSLNDLSGDLDECPCRGPYLDVLEWTEDGTYKTNGEWNEYTLDEIRVNAPIPWNLPNRYEKACYVPDGTNIDWGGGIVGGSITNSITGEFSGMDYMLLYNLACIVHGDAVVGTPYTNMQHYYLTNPIPSGAYSPVGFVDMTTDIIVENGNAVRTRAAESIELLPGFEAKTGSYFEAEIRDGQWTCVNYEYRCVPFHPLQQTANSLSTKSPANPIPDSDFAFTQNSLISVHPNPTYSSITISSNNNQVELISIVCYDINGREVQASINLSSMIFDISNLQPGYYNVCIQYSLDNNIKTEYFKVIKL